MAEYFAAFSTAFIALFVIIDPFAVLPVYLALTDGMTTREKVIIRRKAALVSAGILLTFALSGMTIFKVFGITMPAFRIAGGILLAMVGLDQLNAKRERVQKPVAQDLEEKDDSDEIAIFPLAIPLLAGPGAISTVVLYANTYQHRWTFSLSLVAAVVLALFLSWLVLKFAPLIYRILGRTGLSLLTRLMGIALMAIGVQFVLDGLKTAFPQVLGG